MADVSVNPVLGTIDMAPTQDTLNFGDIPESASKSEVADKARTVTTLLAAMEPDRTKNLDKLWNDSVAYIQNAQNKKQAVEDIQRQFAAKQQEALLGHAAKTGNFQTIDQSPLQPADFKELQKAYEGEQGKTKAEVDAISSFDPNSYTLSDAQRSHEEVNQYAGNLIKGLAEDAGSWDSTVEKAKNYAGFMFVPDFNKDLYDLGMTYKDFSTMAAGFQQLSQDQKMQFLKEKMPQWWEKFDKNPLKMSFMYSLLNNPQAKSATQLQAIFDAVNVADTAGGLISTADGIISAASLVKKAGSLKATEVAASLAERAAKGEVTGEEISGQKALDAVDSMSPFDSKGQALHTNKVDGVSHILAEQDPALLHEINGMRTDVQGVADEATKFTEDFLNQGERATARKNAVEKLRNAAEKQNARLTKVTVDKGNAEEFTISAEFNGNPIKQRYKYTTNDVGQLEIKALDKPLKDITSKLTSAQTIFSNFKDNFVEDLTFASQQSAQITKKLDKISRDIDKGLKGASKQKISDVMITADEQIGRRDRGGKVYTLNELQDGIDTPNGTVFLEPHEIQAYYKRTAFFEQLGQIENQLARRRLEVQGMRDIQYRTVLDSGVKVNSHVVGRPVDFSVLRDEIKPGEFVFDPAREGKFKFSKASAAAGERKGHQVVKMLKPMYIKIAGKDRKVEYMVLNKEGKVNNLPEMVLNIAPGYVPRIRKKGMVYVKNMDSPYRSTVRVFDGTKAADRWIAKTQKELEDTGKEVPNYQAVRDDQLNDVERMLGNFDQVGGLYTSPRKKNPLLFGEDGVTPERANVGQATQSYINSIARSMPINEYRMGMIKRWENTAQAAVDKFGTGQGEQKITFLSQDLPLPETGQAGLLKAMLNRSRTYLKQQFFGQNTNEYTTLKRSMHNLVDFLEDRPILGKKPRDWALKASYSDPAAALKGFTFNNTLGMFNIRQLYVQAQNAALAASMHPQYAIPAARDAMGMNAALYFLRHGREDVVKHIGEIIGVKGDEFLKRTKAFSDSGMYDSIIRTADYDAQAYGVGQESFSGLRKAAAAGRFPFEQGELFSRGTSWGIAARRFRKAEGHWPEAPDEIRKVSDDAFRMHINMQRENAAAWQTNKYLSIPTQFLQARAKFVENSVLGLAGKGQWSRGEAARAVAGQIALYGTIGVPMSQSIYSWIADLMGKTKEEVQNENPNLDEYINEGMMGLITNSLGIDTNISTAGSLLADIDNNVVSALLKASYNVATGRDANISARDISGPSLSVFLRGEDALKNIANRAAYLAQDGSIYDAPREVMGVASDIAAITSTWSNARKAAWLLKNHMILSNRGALQVGPDRITDVSTWDAVFRSMGFPTDEEVALYALGDYNFETKQAENEAVDDITRAAHRAIQQGDVKVFKYTKDAILEPYSDLQKRRIMDQVFNRVNNPTSAADRELNKFVRHFLENGKTDIPNTLGDLRNGE